MIVSIQQPEHWPWLGFFDKVRQVDKVVLLDTVQFKPRYFESRIKIASKASPEGWQWLRIPVKDSRHRQNICDVEIDSSRDWRQVALRELKFTYGKSPQWDTYAADIETIYSQNWEKLADFNINSIRWLAKKLDLQTRFIRASELKVSGKADGLLVNICLAIGATDYLSGKFGKDYINPKLFADSGVRLHFQEFVHPKYHQFRGEFQPGLSSLDVLLNHGEKAAKILRSVPASLA